MWILVLAGLIVLQPQQPRTTLTPDLKRAEQHDKRGWTSLETHDYAAAADAFEAAVQIHPLYADALYGLGKARMALKQYEASARALERSRESYAHAGTEDAEYRLLANVTRQNLIATMRRRLAELEAVSSPFGGRGAPVSSNTEVQDLRQQIRTLSAQRDSGPVTGKLAPVPPFVSLALGSAYFHLERLPDAEKQFRDALAVEPKFGEALSNLALVCLLTGRAQEAQSYVRVAEEARFTINPELKRRIREALQKH